MVPSVTRRRVGLLLLGVLLLLVTAAVAVLGTRFGRRYLERQLRQQLAQSSDLRVSPVRVHLSWHDFPYVTAVLQPLTFTDTAHQRAEPVLQLGRVEARVALSSLLRGRVRLTRLAVHGAVLRAYVDDRGRRWTLHGRRRAGPGKAPTLAFDLDAIRLTNVRLAFRNDYKGSAFAAWVRQAQFTARLRGGVLQLDGQLQARIDSLHNRSGTLLAQRPVQAWVHYRYAFRARQGTFVRTRATLNGDTIRLSGTHTTASSAPAGSVLRLRFEGQQALLPVLQAALPPSLTPYLAGARSPSKAHIRYTISGLSSPTVLPRNVLRFELRQARLLWPDSTRRINHWDLLGVLDNGPAHNARTTSLTLPRCRIYSLTGQLNLRLTVRDFTQPRIEGAIRGHTDLPSLAALIAPGAWRAERGRAALDVQLRGLLPTPANRAAAARVGGLSVRGTVTLQRAAFELLDRRARVADLSVRLRMQDSLWHLANLSGQVDGMRFRAEARTVRLLEYLTGQATTTRVAGTVAADELRIARLGELLRPTGSARPTARAAADSTLLPPGLQLDLGLRCARLVLPADTVSRVAMHVRRDARRTTLSGLSAHMWGGELRGQAAWPAPQLRRAAPPSFQLALRFGTLDYLRLIRLLTKPRPQPAAPRAGARPPQSLAVQELLLAANGQASCQIDELRLPAGQSLRHVRLQLRKAGPTFRMPTMYFVTAGGGVGLARASARVAGGRLVAADANLDLRFATVDVQQLLLALASLQPPEEKERARARRQRPAAARPATARLGKGRAETLLDNDMLTAQLHVRAERVRYGPLTGADFRLTSRLRPGEARLDECALQAFGGEMRLRGRLETDAPDGHHPLHVQAQLTDIALPQLFEVADALHFAVLGSDNVRGTMRCQADVFSDLGADFLPVLPSTRGYVQTAIQDLELLNVTALEQALKMVGERRTSHLYFRPVSTRFFLDGPRLLVPQLWLNSNLTDMEVSGEYYLTGRSNLYIGLNPLQALVGNNRKRVERIRDDLPERRPTRRLLYVNLRRPDGGIRYAVRLFKGREKQEQQAALYQEYRRLLRQQPLDTTLQLLR